uniref:Uncharacterized protein n=1 Tax=Arundo donax TaxID=35708 RepID=A0A0A9FBX8_ARUDO
MSFWEWLNPYLTCSTASYVLIIKSPLIHFCGVCVCVYPCPFCFSAVVHSST